MVAQNPTRQRHKYAPRAVVPRKYGVGYCDKAGLSSVLGLPYFTEEQGTIPGGGGTRL